MLINSENYLFGLSHYLSINTILMVVNGLFKKRERRGEDDMFMGLEGRSLGVVQDARSGIVSNKGQLVEGSIANFICIDLVT